jgi:hypothetical protein
MKLMIAILLLPFAVQAADTLVTCQIAHPKTCKDCGTRIPASCDENGFVGSISASLKPAQINWTVSNPKTGTERLVTTENKTLTLKDLQTAKDLAKLAGKAKVQVGKGEKVSFASVQVASGTELFKGQTGKEIAATLKAQNPQRAIASEGKEVHAGGVGRALKSTGQK